LLQAEISERFPVWLGSQYRGWRKMQNRCSYRQGSSLRASGSQNRMIIIWYLYHHVTIAEDVK